jgi:hypothetical protein
MSTGQDRGQGNAIMQKRGFLFPPDGISVITPGDPSALRHQCWL